jgi:hypothetical protein
MDPDPDADPNPAIFVSDVHPTDPLRIRNTAT